MDIRNHNLDATRGRFQAARADLYNSNREKLEALRQNLADLSEQRGEAAAELRERVLTELAALSPSENADQARAAEQTRRSDRIEISQRAQALASGEADVRAERVEDRAERVAQLREAFKAGKLNTPQAIENAATRMLSEEFEG